MPVIERIAEFAEDLTAIRRDLHAHPELGFEETRTAGIVADLLESWGVATTRGVGRTGVVGVLDGARPGLTIGLRADMDALPIQETTNLPYASKTPGVFHGCGHDGHTAMLLGAARYLAENRDFAGRAVFIFQPAEEGLGGARAMLADGLFERFPCDEIYGLHNAPEAPPGEIAVKPGPAMAGADFFDIEIRGRGAHAAAPQNGRDPILAATALVQALQGVISRNVAPIQAAVLSVTRIEAGTAYNVIPETARISGTLRFAEQKTAELVRTRMEAVCKGVALAHDVEIALDLRNVFDVLVNDAALAAGLEEIAREVAPEGLTRIKEEFVMASEDMSDLLRVTPGAYCTIGHSGGVPVHNPGFVLDDAVLPLGASLYARLVERRGAAAA